MMLRVLTRFESPPRADVAEQRQRVADLCRMLESQVVRPGTGKGRAGRFAPRRLAGHRGRPRERPARAARRNRAALPLAAMRQTLQRLLAGEAEKQMARALGVSPHTVHVYVKAIYRRYGVCSRGELFARFVSAGPHTW